MRPGLQGAGLAFPSHSLLPSSSCLSPQWAVQLAARRCPSLPLCPCLSKAKELKDSSSFPLGALSLARRESRRALSECPAPEHVLRGVCQCNPEVLLPPPRLGPSPTPEPACSGWEAPG